MIRGLCLCMLLWLASPYILPGHAGHVAEFRYSLDGKHLELRFTIERQELRGLHLSDNCDMQKTTALCIARYLQAKTSPILRLS